MTSMPQAFIETFGCAQNESDSEKLRGMLQDLGYTFCDDAKSADLVIYNTCAVRENAELKVLGTVGALKPLKKLRPNMLIGICGCMMQQQHVADEIKRKYTHVDFVFGTHALYRFPEILKAAQNERVFDIGNDDEEVVEGTPVFRAPPPLAKVPIMYGCNNFCTYCVVPYVRGRERSRKPEDILTEIRQLAADGYKEVTLLGQNVNSYDDGTSEPNSFAGLLTDICKIDGIFRVRFVTSHPKDISDELIETMAREDKICKQLHLPIQAGSDKVLADMNRGYTSEKYLSILVKLRAKMPNIAITSDIIVGFPTEGNIEFEDTMRVLRAAEFDSIFSFIFSPRTGTPAADMESVLTDKEKHANFDRMLELQHEISKRKADEYVGTIQSVLIEGKSKTNADVLTGRTDTGKIVIVEAGEDVIGELVDVKITRSTTFTLYGEAVN